MLVFLLLKLFPVTTNPFTVAKFHAGGLSTTEAAPRNSVLLTTSCVGFSATIGA